MPANVTIPTSTLTQYINNYLTKWVPLYIEKNKTHAQNDHVIYGGRLYLVYWLDELKRGIQYE